MPGGARKVCDHDRCSDDRRSLPGQLELYGTHLAFAWSYASLGEGATEELRVDTVGGGHQPLDEVHNGGLTRIDIGWPSFENGRVYWSRACFGDESGCPGRARLVESTYTGTIHELESTAPHGLLSHERDARSTSLLSIRRESATARATPPVAAGTCSLTVTRPDFHPHD